MKRLIPLLLFFCFSATDLHARMVKVDYRWHWRNDDGTEQTATWNTKEEMQEGTLVGDDETIRLRTHHGASLDCAAIEVIHGEAAIAVPYSDFFAFADSPHLSPGDAVERFLSPPGTANDTLDYAAGGCIVEAPEIIPAPPDSTYQEIELCLKARDDIDVPEGSYTFVMPNIQNQKILLSYKHPKRAGVVTLNATNIGANAAMGHGDITQLGLREPAEHGVCWATTGTPDIGDNRTREGRASETGAFETHITGLTPNTTYHLRAYATNSAGTVYGDEVIFTTTHAVSEDYGPGGCFIEALRAL